MLPHDFATTFKETAARSYLKNGYYYWWVKSSPFDYLMHFTSTTLDQLVAYAMSLKVATIFKQLKNKLWGGRA